MNELLGKGGEQAFEELQSKLQDNENTLREYEAKIDGINLQFCLF